MLPRRLYSHDDADADVEITRNLVSGLKGVS